MLDKRKRRPGGGRKSNAQKLLDAGFVASWFTSEFQQQRWNKLAASEDERISLDAMKYLTDRLYGKPRLQLDMDHQQNSPIEFRVVRMDM